MSEEAIAAAERAADADLIVALWRGASDSWSGGVDAGLQYSAVHNYPLFGCTVEALAAAAGDLPDDYYEETIADQATIERDDDWLIPAGPLAGQSPEGRVYILTVDQETSLGSLRAEVHATIIDGEAFFFIVCWD